MRSGRKKKNLGEVFLQEGVKTHHRKSIGLVVLLENPQNKQILQDLGDNNAAVE